jgi:hypothetical protein
VNTETKLERCVQHESQMMNSNTIGIDTCLCI